MSSADIVVLNVKTLWYKSIKARRDIKKVFPFDTFLFSLDFVTVIKRIIIF